MIIVFQNLIQSYKNMNEFIKQCKKFCKQYFVNWIAFNYFFILLLNWPFSWYNSGWWFFFCEKINIKLSILVRYLLKSYQNANQERLIYLFFYFLTAEIFKSFCFYLKKKWLDILIYLVSSLILSFLKLSYIIYYNLSKIMKDVF